MNTTQTKAYHEIQTIDDARVWVADVLARMERITGKSRDSMLTRMIPGAQQAANLAENGPAWQRDSDLVKATRRGGLLVVRAIAEARNA